MKFMKSRQSSHAALLSVSRLQIGQGWKGSTYKPATGHLQKTRWRGGRVIAREGSTALKGCEDHLLAKGYCCGRSTCLRRGTPCDLGTGHMKRPTVTRPHLLRGQWAFSIGDCEVSDWVFCTDHHLRSASLIAKLCT